MWGELSAKVSSSSLKLTKFLFFKKRKQVYSEEVVARGEDPPSGSSGDSVGEVQVCPRKGQVTRHKLPNPTPVP